MSTRRTITVTLTDAQYRALGSAIALADNEDEERAGQAAARDNAWSKIRDAWHDRERG